VDADTLFMEIGFDPRPKMSEQRAGADRIRSAGLQRIMVDDTV
jgi:hypothetical protein